MSNDRNDDIEQRLQFAVQIAHEAGGVTLEHFRRHDLQVERKADQSPVTVADRAAETLLRGRIAERFGDDAIVGEEHGTSAGASRYKWVLDPIDGTKSFIHGVPLYTTLVAVLQDDRPVIGVIHAPATAETVYAATGSGCWYLTSNDGAPQVARVSNVARLSEALFLTTEIGSFADRPAGDAMDVYLRLQDAARLARSWGDGYGYLMVATGRADVMIDPIMNVWDAGPVQTIIEEAGGLFTDWNGRATIHTGEGVATNGLLAEEVLGFTRGR